MTIALVFGFWLVIALLFTWGWVKWHRESVDIQHLSNKQMERYMRLMKADYDQT